MLKPMSEEECAREVRASIERVRNLPRGVRPGGRDVPATNVACARQSNFAARYTPVEADIVVDTPWRGRVLIVEVTWFKEPSIEKAIGHRDIRAPFWSTDFENFMLVLRGDLYIWRRDTPPESPPDFSAPIQNVWNRYLGDLAKNPEALRPEVMEIAISAWLHDLASGICQPATESEADQVLLGSGMYELMKNGTVRTHVIA